LERINKIRISGLSIASFLMMLSYAIVRPSAESLFLASHGSESLPYVWLFVAAAMLCVLYLYNRLIAVTDLISMAGWVSLASALLFLLLIIAHSARIPYSDYAIYVLKDIYVVILVEIFYMYSNSVFPIKSARWLYGYFGALAAAGSVSGNLLIGYLALEFGTLMALSFTIPILVILWLLSIPFAKSASFGTPLVEHRGGVKMGEAASIARRSSYLLLIMALIFTVQIAVTLIDFQFNGAVESAYPDMDLRTGFMGKVYAFINFATFAMHLMTGPILRLATVPGVLVAIPFILGANVISFIALPTIMVAVVAKSASKIFDYTIFKSSKEILYIPLSYEERTVGKAIVDMFSYRLAKGGASLLLMAVIAVGLVGYVGYLSLLLIIVWLIVALALSVRFRRKVSRREEIMGINYN